MLGQKAAPRDLRLSPDDLTSSGWRYSRALLLMRFACALIVYPALARLWPAPDSWWLAIPSAIMVKVGWRSPNATRRR